MGPPLLYIVTDRRATAGRPLDEVVACALAPLGEAAFASFRGRVAVQLRDKDLGGAALVTLGRRLREITSAAGALLFVNSRLDVALACEADGIHLGWRSLAPRDVVSVTNKLQISVSTHSVSEVERVREPGVGFVTFGPIFDTPSKTGILAPRGAEGLRQVATLGMPIVALGGIDASNADACLEAGANGLACVRAVTAAKDPDAATRNLLTLLLKRLRDVAGTSFCKDFSP